MDTLTIILFVVVLVVIAAAAYFYVNYQQFTAGKLITPKWDSPNFTWTYDAPVDHFMVNSYQSKEKYDSNQPFEVVQLKEGKYFYRGGQLYAMQIIPVSKGIFGPVFDMKIVDIDTYRRIATQRRAKGFTLDSNGNVEYLNRN